VIAFLELGLELEFDFVGDCLFDDVFIFILRVSDGL
jgi:hypothetical protein